MSLLEQASLVITPNAVKESKLYSVVPSDGSGDMDVVRATTATRVNSDGLIEVVPRNLLTYSEQFDNENWSKTNISVVANAGTAPDGTLSADRITAATDLGAILQASTQSVQVYTQSVWVKSESGTVSGSIFGTSSSATRTDFVATTEWQRITNTILSLGGTRFPQIRLDLSGTSILIWGAQLEQGSTATEYFPTTTRLNIPRIDYTNGSCPSILVEPQRTNLLVRSEEFDNSPIWPASSGVTRLANQAIAPNGTNTMDLITFPIFGNSISQSVIVISGATYTFSVWLATQSGTQTVEIGNINAGVYQSVTVTNTPQRFQVTQVASATNRFPAIRATANYSILAWGAQLEAGSYPTSYIPTVAATSTRNADVISKTGISGLIGQTEGTLFSNFYYNGQAKGGTQLYPFYIGQGTYEDSIAIGIYEDKLLCRVFVSGTPQNNFVSSTLSIGVHKVAFVYATNNLKLFLDGSLIATDTSATIPTCSQVYIGASGTTVNAQSINVNNNILYKTALTDQECINLTTL